LREFDPNADILHFSARECYEQFKRFIDLLAEEGETDLETETRKYIPGLTVKPGLKRSQWKIKIISL